MIEYDDRYLAHNGVKGQKWGVRKEKQRHDKIINNIQKKQQRSGVTRRHASNVEAAKRIGLGVLKTTGIDFASQMGYGAVVGALAFSGAYPAAMAVGTVAAVHRVGVIVGGVAQTTKSASIALDYGHQANGNKRR